MNTPPSVTPHLGHTLRPQRYQKLDVIPQQYPTATSFRYCTQHHNEAYRLPLHCKLQLIEHTLICAICVSPQNYVLKILWIWKGKFPNEFTTTATTITNTTTTTTTTTTTA